MQDIFVLSTLKCGSSSMTSGTVLHSQKQRITLAIIGCTSLFILWFHHRLIVIAQICNRTLVAARAFEDTNSLSKPE